MRIRRAIAAGLVVTVMATVGATALAEPDARWGTAIAMLTGGAIGSAVVWVVLKLLRRPGQASRES